MGNKEETLKEKEQALEVREAELAKKEAALQQKAADIIAEERKLEALRSGASVVPEPEKPNLTKADKELIAQACKGYGIEERFLLKGRVETDEASGETTAVLITHGGAKVRYQKGQEVVPLDPVRVDGVSRKPKRKPIAGRVNSPKA